MKHSIASVSLPGDIVAKIRTAAAVGYAGIELFENDLTVSEVSATELRSIATDSGIEIVALQPLRDYEAMPGDLAARNLRRARRKLELASRLGARCVLVCSNVSTFAIDDAALASAQLHELAEMASEFGITIGYEALAWGRHINTWQGAWDIVRNADHDNLGLVLDSFHVLVKDTDVSALGQIDPAKIALVQLADAPRLDMGVLHLSRHYRCFPGQGSLAVEDFVQKIHSAGYAGYWSHEIFNDEFRSSRLEPTAVDGKRSLLWLEERVESSTPPAAAPENIDTVAFVEFAVEDRTRNELTDMLGALGFVETHRHRSKDVGLMQLGDVRFVVNAELDSYAYNYYMEHGASVCALGLRTRSAETLRRRAARLDYYWHEGTAPPGQLQIPAVAGLLGRLFYLVDGDTVFEDVDFVRVRAPAADNGIYRIDHLAETVRDSDFLSTTLFYRAMLGLALEETVDLLDPNGVVYSRMARSQSGSFRMSFNTSHNWGTTSQRFVEQARGGGVQQIAMATRDILQTVRNVEPRFLLPIPDNYYDDLAARTELPDAQIEVLKRHGILYDASPSGEFLHCYTRDVAGMFFEIVQRTGGYDRYGESNASVRLAAQHRLARRG